jgi:hypothetical protein
MLEVLMLLTFVGYALTFVLVPMYLISLWRLLRYLETSEPAVFDQLGRPSLVLKNSIANNWRTLRFLHSDELETPRKIWCRRLFWASSVCFVVAAISFTLVVAIGGGE